jgi:hypothetical protein
MAAATMTITDAVMAHERSACGRNARAAGWNRSDGNLRSIPVS